MTRARSRVDETDEQIAVREIAERERRQGRSKESLAWDLVHAHDVELRHIDGRLAQLETGSKGTSTTLGQIATAQALAEQREKQILDKLNEAAVERAKAAAQSLEVAKFAFSRKSETWKTLVSVGALVITAASLLLNQCAR